MADWGVHLAFVLAAEGCLEILGDRGAFGLLPPLLQKMLDFVGAPLRDWRRTGAGNGYTFDVPVRGDLFMLL